MNERLSVVCRLSSSVYEFQQSGAPPSYDRVYKCLLNISIPYKYESHNFKVETKQWSSPAFLVGTENVYHSSKLCG